MLKVVYKAQFETVVKHLAPENLVVSAAGISMLDGTRVRFVPHSRVIDITGEFSDFEKVK